MKKILLTACAALMCVFANAQTIHWLTFIDTTDPNVGKIDVYVTPSGPVVRTVMRERSSNGAISEGMAFQR